MKFFRDKIEDSITLPPPPISDEDEVQEVKVIIANRTAENVESIKIMTKNLSMQFVKFVKNKD